MPKEARRGDDAELGFHPGEHGALQPGKRATDGCCQGKSDQQRRHPRAVLPDQHIVDEHLDHRRNGHARNDQRQRRERGEDERAPHPAETDPEAPQHTRRLAAAAKFGARLERQTHAGEAFFELLRRKPAGSFARVVDVDPGAFDPFQDNEMVELPEDDHRERKIEEMLSLAPEASGREAKFPRRTHHVGGVAAVAGDPAPHPENFQRYPSAVIGEDHAKARRPALCGFHLQDGRYRQSPATARPQIRTKLRRLILRRLSQRPSFSAIHGTTSAAGERLVTSTSIVASVPGVMSTSFACGEVQAKPLTVEGSRVSATLPV